MLTDQLSGLALAFGAYMAAVVLPLLALAVIASSGTAFLSRIDARLWGGLGGAVAGLWVALAVALLGGTIAPHAMLWILLVALPLLSFAGAAIASRVIGRRTVRRARQRAATQRPPGGADGSREAA